MACNRHKLRRPSHNATARPSFQVSARSFADPSSLVFEPGLIVFFLTAINGCVAEQPKQHNVRLQEGLSDG